MSKYWLFLVLAVSASSAAQQQTHLDAATAFYEALNTEESMRHTIERLIGQMPELQAQMGVSEERRAKSEQHLKEVSAIIVEAITSDKMKDQVVLTYAAVFTEEELRELTNFYTSPIGKKYVEKQPELAQAAMRITGEMMRELMPRIKEISSRAKAERTEVQTTEDT